MILIILSFKHIQEKKTSTITPQADKSNVVKKGSLGI